MLVPSVSSPLEPTSNTDLPALPTRKFLAPLVQNIKLSAPGHYVLRFEALHLAQTALPGHFVTIACGTGPQLLRRPFSVFEADPNTGICSILFSVYGSTTKAMSLLEPGEFLDIIGPLGGRVFTPSANPEVHHVLVGGGYGVPPLALLSRRILQNNPHASVTLITGARTQNLLVGTDGLAEAGVQLAPCTDDGSCGFHGLVTGVLQTLLDAGRLCHVYTCGPTPMMKAVGLLCEQISVPCQVSLEVFMPCGVGICMGCAVPKRGTDGTPTGTYARGCTDGPVFETREVAW
jgi:dihydroorotate dehydrogenase electron transfer subunit